MLFRLVEEGKIIVLIEFLYYCCLWKVYVIVNYVSGKLFLYILIFLLIYNFSIFVVIIVMMIKFVE